MQAKTTLLLLFVLCSFSFFAQNVTIDYQNPTGITVCDTATYEITITNNQADTIFNPSVTINLPDGITYDTIVMNATESNVSDLNNPVLGLAKIPPGEQVVVTYTALTACALVDAINAGSLFTNTMTVNWTGGSQAITTVPYTIETPLLVVLSSTNTIAAGTKDEFIIRTFTITNTRLGALSQLNVSDVHQGGIEINISPGSLVSQNATSFEGILDANDFMSIGDGDGLFELGETVTITETILITECGYDQSITQSTVSFSWGCNNEICQSASVPATIQFIPTQDNPNLTFVPTASIPDDFCAELTHPQSMLITNTGTQSATEIEFFFNSADPETMGAVASSFVLDNGGVITPLAPNVLLSAPLEACPDAPTALGVAGVTIPELGPGESVEIKWETVVCAFGCETELPVWTYNYEYNNFCPEDDTSAGGGNGYQDNFNILMVDSVTYMIGDFLMEDEIYTMNYSLLSTIMADSAGILNLEFILPCGMTWQGSDMTLDGQAPFDVDIQTDPEGADLVTLQYYLPFDATFVDANFDVSFSCDPDCVIKPDCQAQYNTSCPPLEICIAPVPPPPIPPLMMSVNTSIVLDTTITDGCAIQGCQDFELVYQCEVDSVCVYDILGFAVHQLESERVNYGLPDNDNDRFADASGSLADNLIRKDRMIPGDFLRNTVSGIVTMEDPSSTFENAQIVFQLQAHTIDFGVNGGMEFDQMQNMELFGFDFLTQVDQSVRIYDASTGDYYDCPVNPAALEEPEIVTIEEPNNRPPVILNEILLRNFEYNVSASALGGCVPNGFLFEEGDSIIFEAQHQMTYNILQGQQPLMINLRAASGVVMYNDQPPGEDPFACDCQANPLQYSGYFYEFGTGSYSELPCDPFDEVGAPFFRFDLAVPNFFPFEFRNLANWDVWEMELPSRLTLLDSELRELRFQGGPIITQNVPLSPTINGNTYSFDIAPFQMPMLDEGFYAEFYHEFESDCFNDEPGVLALHSVISFDDLLPEEENPLDTIQNEASAFQSQMPFLILSSPNASNTSFSNSVSWDIDLSNISGFQAENVYIQLVSASGQVTDLELVDNTTGQVLNDQAGIIQLGNWQALQSGTYTVNGINNSCSSELVEVIFGWNCEPYLEANTPVCNQSGFTLITSSPEGEIEMNITSPTGTFDLCDTVDYHTIEIFNAQLGSVFELILEAQLSTGLNFATGTAQIEYPTGSGFVSLPDPTDIGGGTVQWDISALESTIGMNGLSGIQFMPEHSVTIRFKCTTECGFISSSPVIFNIAASQNCPVPTNTITRAGDPINITGVIPPYSAEISIVTNSAPIVECGDELTLDIGMNASGVTQVSDSIFVYLPIGAMYVPGSYVPGANAPAVEPFIDLSTGVQVLKWQLPANLPANSFLNFQINTTGYGNDNCDVNNILVQTVQSQEAICVIDNSVCSVLAETGSSELTVTVLHPILTLDNLSLTLDGANSMYTVDITNSGTSSVNPIAIGIYLDANGDGIVNLGEELLDSPFFSGAIGTDQIVGTIDIDYEEACSLIAVIDEMQDCICESSATTVEEIVNNIAPYIVCTGADIEIGVATQTGHNYQWSSTNNLGCTNCTPATFSYENTGTTSEVFNYILSDNLGGCVIDNYIDVAVLPMPQIINSDTTVCAGSTFTLVATEGVSYNWTGEGITNPNQQTQTITPTMNGVYTVDITDAANCMATSSIEVNVLAGPSINAGNDLIACDDETVILDGTIADAESFIWLPISAVSNPVSINPTVTVNQTTTITLTATNDIGCTSSDDVLVTFNETPDLAITGNALLCAGDSIQLVATGADNYQWTPNDGSLSCVDCPNPWAQPTVSTVYTLTGDFGDTGCDSEVNLQVFVSGSNQATIDNITICENDPPAIIHGNSVATAGEYCETFTTLNGCDSLSCVTLNINPRNTNEVEELCIGDSITINGTTYFNNAQICEDFVSSFGCDSTHCVNIDFFANPNATIQLDYPNAEAGVELQLDGPGAYDFYEWSPADNLDCSDCEDPIFTPDMDGTFEFILTYGTQYDSVLCRSEVPITIPVFPMCDPQRRKIPTAFSPNGDGVDDVFSVPDVLGLEAVGRIQIFNRWGEKLFDEIGVSEWDGTINGKPAPSDVYMYFIDLSCDGTEGRRFGEVTLLR